MCGRFSFVAPKEKVEQQLPFLEIENNLRHNFNIAPTQHAYVITNDSPNRLQYLTWGLIPYWSREGTNKGKLINARMEGIVTRPSFRLPIRKKRCLILADSYYDWKIEGGQKKPYRVLLRNNELMLMAGIWDTWMKGDYAIKSFSIITCPSNVELSQISGRMPVLITSKKEQLRWLQDIDLQEVIGFFQNTLNDKIFKVHRITDKINSIKNNSPELHQPIADSMTLFN